jgi:hypothetical protein
MRWVGAIVVALTAGVAGYWVFDAVQRNQAIETFESTLSSVRLGDVVDVREAFPLDWDRVVIVGPYEPGATANYALGFEHYDEYESLISGDRGSSSSS